MSIAISRKVETIVMVSAGDKSTLPEREAAICRRLRDVRLDRKWGMPDVAQSLGISRDRLASYEYARAPVRYWLARKFAETFDINFRWLATGQLPMEPYFDIANELERTIDSNAIFSEVYDRILKVAVDARFRARAKFLGVEEESLGRDESTRILPAIGTPASRGAWATLSYSLHRRLLMLPPELYEEFLEKITEAVSVFVHRHQAEIDKHVEFQRREYERLGLANSLRQELLDKDPEKWDKTLMASEAGLVNKLVSRLEPLLIMRGAQSRLARELAVTRQAVNNWLVGTASPSGEIALRLADWVTAEEAKQKNAGAGATAPASKTQPKGSSDETKPKSGRRKK